MDEAERRRLAAVERTHLLDTPAEGRFDRITRIARRLFRVPIATVSVVAGGRRFFKSAAGLLTVWETPSEASLCSHALTASDELLVVPDTAVEQRFASSPLVAGEPHIRFYAGRPFHYEGQRIGVLCVMDLQPREFSVEERQDLIDLAQWVESEVDSDVLGEAQRELMSEREQLREMALVDELTRTWNRRGINEVFTREAAHAARSRAGLSLAMADIDHFKKINDSYGHEAGDLVLKAVAERLRLSVRPYDVVGRVGGEEFILIFPRSSS